MEIGLYSINFIKFLFLLFILFISYKVWANKNKVAYIPLLLLCLFTLFYTSINLMANIHLFPSLAEYKQLLIRVAGIGIVLSCIYLTVEYTGHQLNKKEFVYFLFSYFIFSFLFFITNPYHSILYSDFEIGPDGYLVPIETDVLFLIYVLPTSIMVIGSIFIIYKYSILHTISRKQSLIIGTGLMIGYISISVESAVYTIHQAINIDVIGICIGVFIISFGLIKYNSKNQSPLTKTDIVQNIDDVIISITPSYTISDIIMGKDININVSKNDAGKNIKNIFKSYDVNIVNMIDNNDSCIIKTDQQRYYELSVYEVVRDINVFLKNKNCQGHIMVISDVTEDKRNKEQINILKNIFARVLRHNIRNELNVIQGNIDIIKQNENINNDKIQPIDNSTSNILRISNKARLVEKIINNRDEKVEFSSSNIIQKSVNSILKQYPNVKIQVNIDDSFNFVAHEKFNYVIYELINNGIEHNPSNIKKINIKSCTLNNKKQVIISDNGLGISKSELEPIFNSSEETPLEHGSGLGLWIVKFIIDISGGSIDFEITEQGTRIKITVV